MTVAINELNEKELRQHLEWCRQANNKKGSDLRQAEKRIAELEAALWQYAAANAWSDYASEKMQPDGAPDWTAEVHLPFKTHFYDYDGHGWEIARAALEAPDDAG